MGVPMLAGVVGCVVVLNVNGGISELLLGGEAGMLANRCRFTNKRPKTYA
jgi:hypothetical protein